MTTTLLTCDFCGKNASYNTPWTDGNGKIMCDTCAKKDDNSDHIWYGISQHIDTTSDIPHKSSPSKLQYRYRTVIVNADQISTFNVIKTNKSRTRFQIWYPKFTYACWIKGGAQCFPLINQEITELNKGNLNILKDIYNIYEKTDLYRCTSCGKDFPGDPIGKPLFAGATCESCWTKHLAKLNEERNFGRTCYICGEPYSNCCC